MSVTVTFGKRSFTFSNRSADNQLFTRLRQSEQFYHVRTSKVSVSFYLIACFSRPVTCIQAVNTSKWQFWKSGFRLSISFSVAKLSTGDQKVGVDGRVMFLKPVMFFYWGKKRVMCWNKIISNWFALQDEDSEFTLAADFEIGHFFRERIVPRAVLYFTGEAIEDDDNVCIHQHFVY